MWAMKRPRRRRPAIHMHRNAKGKRQRYQIPQVEGVPFPFYLFNLADGACVGGVLRDCFAA